MVMSLRTEVTGEQIRSVIRSIDEDGGGFIDLPELKVAVKRHEEVNYTRKMKHKADVGNDVDNGHRAPRED